MPVGLRVRGDKILDHAGWRRHTVHLVAYRACRLGAGWIGDVDALFAVLHPQVWGMAEFVADSPIPAQTNHGPGAGS